MPWCEECSKYLTPSSMRDDGTCPTCGRPAGQIEERAAIEGADDKTPWHFKLLVVALVVYLVWRFADLLVR